MAKLRATVDYMKLRQGEPVRWHRADGSTFDGFIDLSVEPGWIEGWTFSERLAEMIGWTPLPKGARPGL